jgi:hypothetical protein
MARRTDARLFDIFGNAGMNNPMLFAKEHLFGKAFHAKKFGSGILLLEERQYFQFP